MSHDSNIRPEDISSARAVVRHLSLIGRGTGGRVTRGAARRPLRSGIHYSVGAHMVGHVIR